MGLNQQKTLEEKSEGRAHQQADMAANQKCTASNKKDC